MGFQPGEVWIPLSTPDEHERVMVNTDPPSVRCYLGHACWWEPFWRFDAKWIHCRRCCWSSSSHRRARSLWWLLRVLVGR